MTAGGTRSRLAQAHWPADAYDRARLPERVLQFGTGMLLRALPVALIDAANRAGRFGGRVAVVQSTSSGNAAALNAQHGLFTLVERGAVGGQPIDRRTMVGSISRALVADEAWDEVRAIAARPELRVIVSNVTEAAFRRHDDDTPPLPGPRHAAPVSFPAKIADVLHARFRVAPHAPPVFVIPTELVDDNGAKLRAMVLEIAGLYADGALFRQWIGANVRFCSSLVDRITTGLPAADVRAGLEAELGYADDLLTVAEPYALWAIESDPALLREAFDIESGPPGSSATRTGDVRGAVFDADIGDYRLRKIRLLNGAHTALAPLARFAGVRTVREAVEHPALGALLRRVLFDEIVPSLELPREAAVAFAEAVLDRFANPWLEHEWRVIATNQTTKTRLRVVPSVLGHVRRCGIVPRGLALGVAAALRHARCRVADSGAEGTGEWRGQQYQVADSELRTIAAHWNQPDVVASALADRTLWGSDLTEVPHFAAAVADALRTLEDEGVDAAIARLGVTSRPRSAVAH